MEADRDTLKAIYDRPDNIPVVARRGTLLFNFWKDAANPRGLWRTTSLESYRREAPEWRVVVDLDDLRANVWEDMVRAVDTTHTASQDTCPILILRIRGPA